MSRHYLSHCAASVLMVRPMSCRYEDVVMSTWVIGFGLAE